MKLVCFEGNKQTESNFFGNNCIFGKRFENTPRYKVFFYSIDVFFQPWNSKLLILGPIWFSNFCPKHSRPIILQDILNLDIAKTIWGLKSIFCKGRIDRGHKSLRFLRLILTRCAWECSKCCQQIRLPDSWNPYISKTCWVWML